MSAPTSPEVKELSPVDFIQLQQYIECEYRRAGRAAFSLLSATPTPLPLPPTHTHTHTLIYTRGFSYLEEVSACSVHIKQAPLSRVGKRRLQPDPRRRLIFQNLRGQRGFHAAE